MLSSRTFEAHRQLQESVSPVPLAETLVPFVPLKNSTVSHLTTPKNPGRCVATAFHRGCFGISSKNRSFWAHCEDPATSRKVDADRCILMRFTGLYSDMAMFNMGLTLLLSLNRKAELCTDTEIDWVPHYGRPGSYIDVRVAIGVSHGRKAAPRFVALD